MKKSLFLAAMFLLGFVLSTSGCDWGSSADNDCTGPNCNQDDQTPIDFDNGNIDDEDPIDDPVDDTPVDDTPVDDDPIDDPVDDPPVSADKELLGIDLTAPHAVGMWDDSTQTEVVEGDLTPDEKEKIDLLRETIFHGLEIGQMRFIETVSMDLQAEGIANDYESIIAAEGLAGEDLTAVPDACPFVKFYDNGFIPQGVACEYLVDMAKTEVYSELTQVLDAEPIPPKVDQSNLVTHDEASFWMEQGAISGIEENRILIRGDMKKRGFCSKNPTPIESSYDKGVLIGRKVLADEINKWLKSKGMIADYPKMTQQIQACNANQTMLNPAHDAALKAVDTKAESEPLCKDYQAVNEEDGLKYFQAKADYKKGIKNGINDEFEIATVKIFKLIPCALGSPIVIDLDGDGIELTQIHQGVNFDLWGTNTPHAMSWVGKDDGFLVRDLNGNGKIDSGLEMFGNINNGKEDGFEMLAELDSDRNGVIDPSDKAFAGLRIWKDNGNGITEAGELIALDSLGLKKISLATESKPMVIAGNVIYKAVWVDLNGKSNVAVDAFLRTAPHASSTVSR